MSLIYYVYNDNISFRKVQELFLVYLNCSFEEVNSTMSGQTITYLRAKSNMKTTPNYNKYIYNYETIEQKNKKFMVLFEFDELNRNAFAFTSTNRNIKLIQKIASLIGGATIISDVKTEFPNGVLIEKLLNNSDPNNDDKGYHIFKDYIADEVNKRNLLQKNNKGVRNGC